MATGGITGGGGAAAVTVDVINNMWSNAQAKSDAGDVRVGQAINYASPAPTLLIPHIAGSFGTPSTPSVSGFNAGDAEAMYDAKRAEMEALITNSFAAFISTYFPDSGYFNRAIAWLDQAIQGGTGISPVVEGQLWERARARILGDSERAEDEAMSTWAGRRFPLPPGALANQIDGIRLDAGRKLAEQSRDISVKSFDAELENVRFAVSAAIDLRKKALDAAGDYIKTIMLGPQTAMQLATGLANVQAEVARTAVAFYSARVAALEPAVRVAIADAQIQLEGAKANLDASRQSIEEKVRAAITGAQMLGTQAAAGLNAIGGRASISGNDSSTV